MPKIISTFVTRAVFCNSDGSVSICTFLNSVLVAHTFETTLAWLPLHHILTNFSGVANVHEKTKEAFYKG
jgi:hypothetical protein